jgi:hypothetical protein
MQTSQNRGVSRGRSRGPPDPSRGVAGRRERGPGPGACATISRRSAQIAVLPSGRSPILSDNCCKHRELGVCIRIVERYHTLEI